MGRGDIHGRARVDPRAPSAFGVCDNCGEWRNLSDLAWEYQWHGPMLMRTGFRVCFDKCLDTPQPQLKPIILPIPDPQPVPNPRPELANTNNGTPLYASAGALTVRGVAPGVTTT